jgi:hypothetical protein
MDPKKPKGGASFKGLAALSQKPGLLPDPEPEGLREEAARLLRRIIASRTKVYEAYVAIHGEEDMLSHIMLRLARGVDNEAIMAEFDDWQSSDDGLIAEAVARDQQVQPLDQLLLELLDRNETDFTAALMTALSNREQATGNTLYGIMANAAKTMHLAARELPVSSHEGMAKQ